MKLIINALYNYYRCLKYLDIKCEAMKELKVRPNNCILIKGQKKAIPYMAYHPETIMLKIDKFDYIKILCVVKKKIRRQTAKI